jgi:hypothetical protein
MDLGCIKDMEIDVLASRPSLFPGNYLKSTLDRSQTSLPKG